MAKLLRDLIDLLYPPRCAFCRRFVHRRDGGTCGECRAALPFTGEDAVTTGDYGACAAPFFYKGDVRKSLQRFKFSGMSGYAETYARHMAETVRAHFAGMYDVITWVPVSARKLKSRGYDQAQLLAYALALELEDVAVSTLGKIRENETQSTLTTEKARMDNVRGAFAVTEPELVEGKHVLLVDDILTTGATLAACVDMLKASGAEDVRSIVVARVRHGDHGWRTGEEKEIF